MWKPKPSIRAPNGKDAYEVAEAEAGRSRRVRCNPNANQTASDATATPNKKPSPALQGHGRTSVEKLITIGRGHDDAATPGDEDADVKEGCKSSLWWVPSLRSIDKD